MSTRCRCAFGSGLVREGDLNLQFTDCVLHAEDLGVALRSGDGVLVDGGTGADVFGLVGVAEGGERLVVVAWGDAGDHGCFAVAAETVFQEPGQDAVSVGHYVAGGALSAGVYAPVFGVCEGGDDATEGGERFVDVGSFS